MLGHWEHWDEPYWCYWEPWVRLCHITGVAVSIWTDYTGVTGRTGVDCAVLLVSLGASGCITRSHWLDLLGFLGLLVLLEWAIVVLVGGQVCAVPHNWCH